MKVIAAAQQKGGVGKSNTICHLAFYFSQKKNLRTLVIELDPQGNAGLTLQAYNSNISASSMFSPNTFESTVAIPSTEEHKLVVFPGDPALVNIEAMDLSVGDTFAENIERLSPFFDVCLIDTAPSLGVKMSVALYVAQYVFTPIQMAVYSISGVQKMYTTIANMREYNPDLVFLGLLPSMVDMRVPRQRANLKQLQDDHPDKLLPCKISLRSPIAEALDTGVPVWDIKLRSAKAAAEEIFEFSEYISNKVGL